MNQLTSSQAASPAKTSAQETLAPKVCTEVVPASGSSSSVSSRNSGRVTSSPRTPRCFALADWKTFSGHLMRSGTMRSGTVSPLASLVPATNGTASGLLPTPTCSDAKGAPKGRYYGSPTYRHNLSEALRDGPNDPIYPHPECLEEMMGFPKGHSATRP